MTPDVFYAATLVCPYCNPALPRQKREIKAIDFESHRDHVHTVTLEWRNAWAQRDNALVEAACQRAFERALLLGDRVLVRWESPTGIRFEALGTVIVLGAGFFRVDVGAVTDESVRVPEYGCDGWSPHNCVRPEWEHVP